MGKTIEEINEKIGRALAVGFSTEEIIDVVNKTAL